MKKLAFDVDMHYRTLGFTKSLDRPSNSNGLVKEVYIEDLIMQQEAEGYEEDWDSKMMQGLRTMEKHKWKKPIVGMD